MRRLMMTGITAVALAVGAAGIAVAQDAPAEDPVQQFRIHARDADRALHSFRDAVAEDAYETDSAVLDGLREHVDEVGEGLDAMEAVDLPADADVRGPKAIGDMREAHDLMRTYMEHGRDGEQMEMQITVWRYLWVMNRLPLSDG